MALKDRHGRIIDYVRIAVTDKCNLRCFYCMPEEGIKFVQKRELLQYEEIERLTSILAGLGISKIRITGGEPLLRKDITSLFRSLSKIEGISNIALTTNGTLTGKYLDELIEIGVNKFNLSLDTLNRERFLEITRRDYFDEVMVCMKELLQSGIDLKLNCVVMEDKNIEDIIPFVELTRNNNISIRFIEEMPFNGTGSHYTKLKWNYKAILNHIEDHFGSIKKIEDPPHSTSLNYQVPGFEGKIGVIPAYSRTFCGTCNRLRVTPQGIIKTCLYDEGIFNVKDLMRNGATDNQIKSAIIEAVSNKAKDGFEAEQLRIASPTIIESMSTIGG